MKKLIVTGFVGALLAAAAVVLAQEPSELPKPQKEHAWLEQLAGEWEADIEALVPGQEPLKSKGTESVRKIGGFWVLAENKSEFQGQPFTGLLTLGYDAGKETYVGTWIDSMTGYLWTYEGTVDPAGKVLTLKTKGPSHTPGELAKFKEVLELKSKDHKVFTSYIEGENGEWTRMMTINYRRKK